MVRVIRFVRFVVLSRCGQVLSGLDNKLVFVWYIILVVELVLFTAQI